MKKISIHCISDKQENTVRTNLKRYRIFLAWGTTNLFKNKKKAAIFEAGLNTWLNNTFYELNSIYANLLYQNRRSWIFNSLEIDDIMTKNFQSIERNIHKLYRAEYRGYNGAYYAFEAIESVSDELKACNDKLIENYHQKKDWERIKELRINETQLKRILRELTETSEPGSLGIKLRREE